MLKKSYLIGSIWVTRRFKDIPLVIRRLNTVYGHRNSFVPIYSGRMSSA